MEYDIKTTENVNKMLQYAKSASIEFNASDVATECILYGITCLPETFSAQLLAQNSITQKALYDLLFESREEPFAKEPELTPKSKQIFVMAQNLAREIGSQFVDVEHILFALLMNGDSVAVNILQKVFDIDVQSLKSKVMEYLKSSVSKSRQNDEPKQQQKQDKPQKKVGQQNKQQSAQLLPEEREEKYLKKHFSNNQTSVEFVQGLLKLMGQDAVVTLEETREESKIEIESESVGKIVGHRGECLNAIQYLANTVEEKTNPTAKRVVVDCGKYKVRHEEDLRALAIKIAGKVSETGKPYRLDPMTAYDRRIVHTELVNYPTVETHSEGVEPHRYIVVTRKKVQK